ncbi:2Fe-2S iron-sulfur cluster protein [Dongia mobilis]|uniref:2Fe-2S iron-sulfur cluster protein n=1 Tax=Dongia mobilis TaxID=578943 RepID=A0A4R6WRJ7_9PROT|nr:(2Fe-2S)-binding protein [Dongia mobilis]TDQ84126.1 2Fe-2S iron-sulfur cluster protein [Dongia mobilis]
MRAAGPGCVINWNGEPLQVSAGESVAAALFRAGHLQLAATRKRHRPLGLSGSFIQGVLGDVDGIPNARLDQVTVRDGMHVARQNTWPSSHFDLLKLLRLVPARLVRGGFEHTRLMPSGTRRYLVWERLLAFLAGEGTLSPVPAAPAVVAGRRIDCDLLVIGGGPEGIGTANAAAHAGRDVVLVTRGSAPARFARLMGITETALDSRVTLLTAHEACAIYRQGHLVLAAPGDGGPAVAIGSNEIVLATGKHSLPPLVRGNTLPGVMDAATALALAAGGAACLGRVVVVGTETREAIAARLHSLGAAVAEIRAVAELKAIKGWNRVTGAVFEHAVPCQTVVHAGPWRSDPNLSFQASGDGLLRLSADALPAHVRMVGSAAAPDERIHWPGKHALDADVCPCMDVSAREIADLLRAGVTHVEEIKRQTSAGMGPCQGFPCWELMAAVIENAAGAPLADRPSHRGPRRAITVAQAAGLSGLVDPLK